MTAEAEILFERRGAIGLVTLNRPKALNALTLGMVDAMDPQLRAWAADDAVKAVVVIGAGERAFCAGGDIRALYDSGKQGTPYAADFWAREYRLNTLIKRYPKPYIALLNGITMGGGVGLSVHGRIRVACEATVFAMPETGIGLFPDVGGSYALPRMPGETGMYAALTGARLKAADMLYTGIATHHVPLALFPALIEALAAAAKAIPEALAAVATAPGEAPLAALRPAIDRHFAAGGVAAILEGLDRDATDFARDTAAAIRTKSPTSTLVTFRQLRLGRTLTFEDCMRLEYRLTAGFAAGTDFYEGVRATIIDKDGAPRWAPSRLEDVPESAIDAYFAPRPDRVLTLD